MKRVHFDWSQSEQVLAMLILAEFIILLLILPLLVLPVFPHALLRLF